MLSRRKLTPGLDQVAEGHSYLDFALSSGMLQVTVCCQCCVGFLRSLACARHPILASATFVKKTVDSLIVAHLGQYTA